MRRNARRGLQAVLILSLPVLSGCAVGWRQDLDRGMAEARETNRRALVQYYVWNNPDCREMDEKVFKDPEVERLMQEHFVPIRLDGMIHKNRAAAMGVERFPTFFVYRPDGSLAGTRAGFLDADAFRAFLIKTCYN